MKRFKVSLAIVALILGIAVSAFTTKESSAKAMFVDSWYEFVGTDPNDPADYNQVSFTNSDQQAIETCPASEVVCASKFTRGASGQPSGTPINTLLGDFTP